MKSIQIIGIETDLFRHLVTQVEIFIEEHNLQLNIELINTYGEILRCNVSEIPTIVYNELEVSIKSHKDISKLVRQIFKAIKIDNDII